MQQCSLWSNCLHGESGNITCSPGQYRTDDPLIRTSFNLTTCKEPWGSSFIPFYFVLTPKFLLNDAIFFSTKELKEVKQIFTFISLNIYYVSCKVALHIVSCSRPSLIPSAPFTSNDCECQSDFQFHCETIHLPTIIIVLKI